MNKNSGFQRQLSSAASLKSVHVCVYKREGKGGTGGFCLTSASVLKRSQRKMLSLAQANKFPHLASVSSAFSEFSSHHTDCIKSCQIRSEFHVIQRLKKTERKKRGKR